MLFLLFFLIIAIGATEIARARKLAEIIFSHEAHIVSAGLECKTCHPGVIESRLGTDNLLPEKATCLECHAEESCGFCHNDPENALALEPVTHYSAKFSHAAHVGLISDCRECHEVLSSLVSAKTGSLLPPMKPCMVCHDGERADKSCILCHEETKGKVPADHLPSSWLVEHVGSVLADDGESCMMCHTNDNCQVCHAGDYLVP